MNYSRLDPNGYVHRQFKRHDRFGSLTKDYFGNIGLLVANLNLDKSSLRWKIIEKSTLVADCFVRICGKLLFKISGNCFQFDAEIQDFCCNFFMALLLHVGKPLPINRDELFICNPSQK